ncbi:TIGR01620 family protein [Methylophaga sp. OBS3]|uniref:TIGR01620 family protein n=1 Tax=Methylophaga sp. OBS3 TaxID=2991934 RepID=UPI0022574A68|nr:TIGR01620 family protein [Methylophaga sp. OBS3]MCX4188870.1 TIGR01620 family protein [Methylophaga sp. OBS3]
MSEQDPYFKDKPKKSRSAKAVDPETFFTVRKDKHQELSLPASVSEDIDIDITLPTSKSRWGLKAWCYSFIAVLVVWMGYDWWQLMQELLTNNVWLAGIFALLVAILLVLTSQQLWLGWRSRRQLRRVNELQDFADQMRHEQSRGRQEAWLVELDKLYAKTPHHSLLQEAKQQLPDYLHDGEVVQHVDEHFFNKLDHQALALIQRDSVQSAMLVAVSQLAIVDTLWVVWKTLKMVNQIHLLYGVRLGTIAQWQLNLRVCKVALLSYSTQAGLTLMAEKTSLGLSGKIAGSVAQGVGVGLYQARIGFSAMQQIRPVPFNEGALPKNRFLSNIAKSCLSKLRNQSTSDD